MRKNLGITGVFLRTAHIPHPNPTSGGGQIPNFVAILDAAVTSEAPIVGKRQVGSIEGKKGVFRKWITEKS